MAIWLARLIEISDLAANTFMGRLELPGLTLPRMGIGSRSAASSSPRTLRVPAPLTWMHHPNCTEIDPFTHMLSSWAELENAVVGPLDLCPYCGHLLRPALLPEPSWLDLLERAATLADDWVAVPELSATLNESAREVQDLLEQAELPALIRQLPCVRDLVLDVSLLATHLSGLLPRLRALESELSEPEGSRPAQLRAAAERMGADLERALEVSAYADRVLARLIPTEALRSELIGRLEMRGCSPAQLAELADPGSLGVLVLASSFRQVPSAMSPERVLLQRLLPSMLLTRLPEGDLAFLMPPLAAALLLGHENVSRACVVDEPGMLLVSLGPQAHPAPLDQPLAPEVAALHAETARAATQLIREAPGWDPELFLALALAARAALAR